MEVESIRSKHLANSFKQDSKYVIEITFNIFSKLRQARIGYFGQSDVKVSCRMSVCHSSVAIFRI